MIVATPSQKDSLVPTHLRSGGGTRDLLAWDEIFTSVGEYSAGRSEQFFLANGGGYYLLRLFWGYFWATLWLFCGYFRTILVLFCGYFWAIFGMFLSYFVVIFGPYRDL